MLHDILIVLFLAFVPACFSFLLDYALGFPGKDQLNLKAVLFGWSFWLAKKALIKSGRWGKVMDSINEFALPEQEQITLTIFIEGRKEFTWQQVLGMCMFCTNFWLSILSALIMVFTVHLQYFPNILLILFIPIFSHFYLRKF